ncbi:MAG: MGDG synthase family glycosyltransferase [Planctomycetota bacterium]|jgi:processive 1,2-diacylglycerol beta-glucosyltransferase
MGKTTKVLIIAIKAGAGHLRAAAALDEVLSAKPNVEVKQLEALEYTNAAFRKVFTETYHKLATDLPSVWGMIYGGLERKAVESRSKKLTTLLDRMNSRKLVKAVRDYAPDRIVCTHYFPAETLAALRRRGELDIPIHVTLTDYDIHTMWIQEGVDKYYVASDEMAHALREKGVYGAEVEVSGIPPV